MRERWRMVHVFNGRRSVSSVVVEAGEVRWLIEAEAYMHEATGWRVEVYPADESPDWKMTALSPSGRMLQTVRAECFDAMNDHPC